MKRMYITTVFRRDNERGKEGRIHAIDWETKASLWEKNTEAVRGMAFIKGQLFVASFNNELRTVDTETGDFTATWEYPEIRRLHKIYYRKDKNVIVLPSTGNDSVATIDVETMKLIDKTHLANLYRDTLHFNSMGWDGDGCEYHLYHRPGTVVKAATGETVFDNLQGAHDLEFIDDYRVVINHTSSRQTLVGDVKTGELKTIFEAEDGPSTTVSMWGGTRGAVHHNGVIFTGSFPTDIHMFKIDSWDRLDWHRVSSAREESLFDIILDPRDWKD